MSSPIQLRKVHEPRPEFPTVCIGCGQLMPCDALVLADEVRRLQEPRIDPTLLTEAMRNVYQGNTGSLVSDEFWEMSMKVMLEYVRLGTERRSE